MPGDVGGREDAEGAGMCGGSRVHKIRVGAVARAVVGGGAPGLLVRVVGRGEEGLEHWTEATVWINREGDEDHVSLVEFANDGVTVDEWGGWGCWLVHSSEFGAFMTLKIVVCIGSDGCEDVFSDECSGRRC